MSVQEPRASLDHFIGRPVESVLEGDESSWGIILEGGIVISNKDANRPMPEDLDGKTLMTVTLSETETRMLFGNSGPTGLQGEVWIDLTPTEYTIAGLEGQTKEFYPQMPEELEAVLPRDPSPDRIVDGPVEVIAEKAASVTDSKGQKYKKNA